MIALNYNIHGVEARLVQSTLDQYFSNVKADLYELQQAEYNLMNDSQKLYDLQTEYMNGMVDYSAVVQAERELYKSKADWYKKSMKYLGDSNDLENALNLQAHVLPMVNPYAHIPTINTLPLN